MNRNKYIPQFVRVRFDGGTTAEIWFANDEIRKPIGESGGTEFEVLDTYGGYGVQVLKSVPLMWEIPIFFKNAATIRKVQDIVTHVSNGAKCNIYTAHYFSVNPTTEKLTQEQKNLDVVLEYSPAIINLMQGQGVLRLNSTEILKFKETFDPPVPSSGNTGGGGGGSTN